MAFGSEGRLKSDVAEGVTKVVARMGVRRGGRLGLVAAGAESLLVLPPRGGRQALAEVDRLLSHGVAADGERKRHDLADGLTRVRALARQPGLVVVASDFRDEGPWQRAMRNLVASGQQVIAVEILDPRELELPDSGVLVLIDPETGRHVEADTSSSRLREAFAKREATRRERVAGALRRSGARHAVVRTDRDWLRDFGKAIA